MKKAIFIVGIVIILIIFFFVFKNYKTKKYAFYCDAMLEVRESIKSKILENCSSINDSYCSDYCKLGIITASTNPNNCETIKDIKYKDICYIHMAKNLNNISLCANLSGNSITLTKEFCEKLYNDLHSPAK